MAFSWILRKQKRSATSATFPADKIILRVENGLLMTFGPDGDPLPPSLVKSICADHDGDSLKMETGQDVDQRRVLAVLDAQQRGQLSERRDSRWVKAMLGLAGGFEETPSDLLTAEAAGPVPSPPAAADVDDQPGSEWLTPLTFDDAETMSMADADAIIVDGLHQGMRLSAGHFDASLNSWVVRPSELTDLTVHCTDDAIGSVAIDITAVSTQGSGSRWPITSRQLDLA